MSASYGWIITKDHLDGSTDSSDAGTMGPSGIPYAIEERLKSGEGTRFRLYDDDDILYYEGLYLGDITYSDPLQDFGTPNAGCTYMTEYQNGNEVEVIG